MCRRPTDSRPFFFNQLRFTHPSDIYLALRECERENPSIRDLGGNGNLIAAARFLGHSAVGHRGRIRRRPADAVRRSPRRPAIGADSVSGYFLLIGFGFMFVEIGLIQRISVFLGHPVYALSIGLFSIILSTGLAVFCPSG